MVGNNPDPRPGPNVSLVMWVFERITPESHRFLSVDDRGRFTVSLDRLAVLVAEIVIEHTADLYAQLDAVNDAVLELLHDVEAGGR